MERKLRLLMLEECDRKCKGCCNKDWDLKALPVCKSFEGYKEIILTGGEPLLRPGKLLGVIANIRMQTSAPIYVYTAFRKNPMLLMGILNQVDGMTLTLHTPKDVAPFVEFNNMLLKHRSFFDKKSLRLNAFRSVSLAGIDTSLWEVKKGMQWIKDCPLPDDEVFMRLEEI